MCGVECHLKHAGGILVVQRVSDGAAIEYTLNGNPVTTAVAGYPDRSITRIARWTSEASGQAPAVLEITTIVSSTNPGGPAPAESRTRLSVQGGRLVVERTVARLGSGRAEYVLVKDDPPPDSSEAGPSGAIVPR